MKIPASALGAIPQRFLCTPKMRHVLQLPGEITVSLISLRFFFFWWVGYHNALCLITVVSSLFLLFVSSFLLFHTCMNVLYTYIIALLLPLLQDFSFLFAVLYHSRRRFIFSCFLLFFLHTFESVFFFFSPLFPFLSFVCVGVRLL